MSYEFEEYMEKYNDYYDALEIVKHNQAVQDVASSIISDKWEDAWSNDVEFEIWYDISLSMMSHPELVRFDSNRCPMCGHNRIQLHYIPLDKSSIGQNIQICTNCKKYFGINNER